MPTRHCSSLLCLFLCLPLAGCGGKPGVQVQTDNAEQPPHRLVLSAAEDEQVIAFLRHVGQGDIEAATFSPDGKTLAAWMHSRVRLWDLESGRILCTVEPGADPAWDCRFITFSPDGKRLATVHDLHLMGADRLVIHVWDLTPDRQLRRAQTFRTKFRGGLPHVSFSPDGQELAAGNSEDTVHIWNLGTGKQRLSFQGGVAANLSADGRTITTVTYAGLVRNWEAATGRLLHPGPPSLTDIIYVDQVVFSPDGQRVALSDGFHVSVKRTADGQGLCRLVYPRGVRPLAFLPDGKILAVSDQAGCRFVDVSTGQQLAWLSNQEGRLLALSRDSQRAARAWKEWVVIEDTAVLLASQDRPPAESATDPPGVPLAAKLVARQDVCIVCEPVSGGYPSPPMVDLELHLSNTGTQALTFETHAFFGGWPWPSAGPHLHYHLLGKGAFNLRGFTFGTGVGFEEDRPPNLVLPPGKSVVLAISKLDSDYMESTPYWILPGQYEVHARWQGTISPAPKEARDGYVTVRASPVKVRVMSAKGAPPLALDDPLGLAAAHAPRRLDGSEGVRDQLGWPANLGKGLGPAPLKEILELLASRYELTILLDDADFRKAGKDRIGETLVSLPPLNGASLGAVLHIILDQVYAAWEFRGLVRKNELWIVPLAKPQGLTERLRPTSLHHLEGEVVVEEAIEAGTPLSKALALLADRYDLLIVIDRRAFERAGIKDIEKQPVSLPRLGATRRRIALEKLLNPVGASFVVRDYGIVLVVPIERIPIAPAELR